MTSPDVARAQVVRLCNGNHEALQWIQIGRQYVHEVDDLIDIDLPASDIAKGAERMCKIGALAIELYAHPFFAKHSAALGQAMVINTNNYADSVLWEKSEIKWRRDYADWARHGWIDVLLVVAYICGGYEHMRNESQALRSISYDDHHDETGRST